MTVTERLLHVLDRAAAAGADQVVIVPGDGTRLCHPSWDELRHEAEYQFTSDEMRGIDRHPADLGIRSGTHTVLLNYRDTETGVTTTVWELTDDTGGHIRLGTKHHESGEEPDGNQG